MQARRSATFALSMQRIPTLLATAAAALAVTPAVAGAAMLSTDSRCYQETAEVVVRGAGFAPLSIVSVTRNGAQLGTAQADANGAFENKIVTPELPSARQQATYKLSATDTLSTATTRYRATKVFADFDPGKGNPSTLRVRFTVNGFGLLRQRARVYLHYVRPSGEVARTVRIGKARGPCGVIRRTKRFRLFPFEAERGEWVLQFDTNERYERATAKSRFAWVRKPVQVFSRRRR
jgi:hypothetical protein